MARKDVDFDDLDLDSLGLDDLEMELDPSKDDRKPITKVATGFVDGLKSTAKDPQFLRRTLLRALPDGYGKAARLLDEAGGVAGDLYNSTARELGPAARGMAKAAKAAMPNVKRYLPKGTADKLEAYLERQAEVSGQGSVGVNQDEANMAMELGQLFQIQAKSDQETRAQEAAEKRVRQVVDDKKHLQSIDQLDAIRQASERLVSYQDTITNRFQRKQLELQYRQYFAQRDLLELQKTSNEGILNYLKDVVKNTGLPEAVKLNLSEASGQMFRDRMLQAAQGSVAEFTAQYTRRFADNLKGRVQQELGAFGAGMGGLGGGMSLGDIDGLPGGRYGIAGNVGGGLFGEYLGRKVGDKARGYANRNEKVKYGGAQLGYFADNIAGIANRWAKKPSQRDGVLGGIERFLQSIAPKQYLETGIENDSVAKADMAVHFNAQARKSITEIIPGYLARILRSIDILRTGDENTELTLYNLDRNQFTSASQVKRDVALRLFPLDQLEGTRNDVGKVIDQIDPEGKLSPAARKQLQSQILRDVASGDFFDPSRYADSTSYGANVDENSRAELSSLFKNQFQIGDDGKMAKSADLAARREAIAKDFNWIQRSVPNSRANAQMYTNVGYADILRDIGVTNKAGMDDRLNFDRILEIYEEGRAPDFEVDDGQGTQGVRQTRRNRRGKRPRADFASDVQTVRVPTLDAAASGFGSSDQARGVGGGESLITAVTSNTDRLIAAIGQERELNIARNDKLDEMLVRLDMMQSVGDFGPGSPSMRGRLRSIMSRSSGAAKTAYGKLRALTGRAIGIGMSVAASPFNAAMGIINFAKTRGAGLLQRGREIVQDIYVKGMSTKPALLAKKLMDGEYRDELTGKVIKSVKDITGPVVDAAGNYVVTAEEYAKGLYDSKGKKLISKLKNVVGGLWAFATAPTRMMFDMAGAAKNWVKERYTRFRDIYVKGELEPRLLALKLEAGEYVNAKTGKVITNMREIRDGVMDKHGNTILAARETANGLLDKTGRAIRGVAMAPINLVRGAWKLGGKALQGGIDMISGALGMFTDYVGAGNKQVGLLEEIRDIINERMPKKLSGDGNGDGLRDGSWQAQQAGRKAKDRIKGAATKEAGRGGNLFAGLGAAASGIGDMFDGGPDIDVDMDSDGKRRGRGRGGKWGRRLKGLGRGVMNAGRGLLNGSLIRGGLALGAGAISTIAASSVTGAVVNGAIAVGGAIASVVSAPVLLAVGAVAAVGVGAYFAYKYFKKKGAYLAKIRMAQYGVDPEDEDKAKMVAAFEELVQGQVKVGKGSPAELAISAKLVEEAIGLFGLDKEDHESLNNWATWVRDRFKPVFLSHATALAAVAPEAKVLEADDKVPDISKLEYLNRIKFPESDGPYTVMASPFGPDTQLLSGTTLLNDLLAEATEKYADLAKKGEKKEEGMSGRARGMGLTTSTAPFAAVGSVFSNSGASPAGEDSTNKFGRMAGLTLTGTTTVGNSALNGAIDQITAVRLRTYGLSKLSYLHAKLIEKLEDAVLPMIRYDNDAAVFNGSAEKLLLEHGAQFGITEPNSDAGKNWMIWFNNRFMPTLLNYCASIRKVNKGATVFAATETLKPHQKLDVALSVAGATALMKDVNVSVWTVKESPFAFDSAYVMNTDPNSVKESIALLQEAVKNAEIQERRVSQQQTRAQNAGIFPVDQSLRNAGKDPFQTQPSMMAIHRTSNYGKTASPILDKMRSGGTFSAADFTGGRVVVHPGGGTGGDINTLPVPGGDGWTNMKDMIVAAAKMAGVDPGLMAAKASIESSFKGSVKAGTSSASGLYQFIDSTWNAMLSRYGSKYGIAPGTPRSDARANALMAAEYLKENQAYLEKKLGRPMTDVDLYAGHFLGAGGATTLLSADPNTDAVALMPDAARANAPIFYEGGRSRTVGEVYAELTRRVRIGDKYADEARSMSGMPAGTVATNAPPTPSGGAVAAAGAGAAVSSTTAAPAVPSMLAPMAPGEKPKSPSSVLASFAPGGDSSASKAAVGSMLLTGSSNIATAPAPAPVVPATESADAAVVQSRQVAERQAAVTEQQARYTDEVTTGSLRSVESLLAKSLDVQVSIDSTLKGMSQDLKVLVQNGGKSAPAPLMASNTPSTPSAPKPPRVTETLSSQAPVSMDRRKA